MYVGTSFGGTFALAHALADPASAAGLVIVDTDFPQADVTRRCVALGVPRKACGPDPGDALAEGWNREVAHRVASLGDRPVRVLTSTVFDPSCPTRFDCPLINKRTVAFQSSAPPPSELGAVEVGVEAAGGEQLGVRAALDDPAVVDDEDLVGVADGRQPVRDDDRRTSGQSGREGPLHRDLRLGVEVGRRLVEDDDPRAP